MSLGCVVTLTLR